MVRLSLLAALLATAGLSAPPTRAASLYAHGTFSNAGAAVLCGEVYVTGIAPCGVTFQIGTPTGFPSTRSTCSFNATLTIYSPGFGGWVQTTGLYVVAEGVGSYAGVATAGVTVVAEAVVKNTTCEVGTDPFHDSLSGSYDIG